MSSNVVGLIAGALSGLAAFAVLSRLARYAEEKSRSPEQRRIGEVFRFFGYAALLVGPLKGYFVMPMVLGY